MTSTLLAPRPWRTKESRPGIWVVLATYNEAENLEAIARRILSSMPGSRILVVDEASPDGTGLIADTLAAAESRIDVIHREANDGPGRAYLAGFAAVLARGADIVVQMDPDGSHDPAALWPLIVPIAAGRTDVVIASRYITESRILDWGWHRRLLSRIGSLCARTILGIPVQDLTGGYKAWRSSTLAAIHPEDLRGGGPGFQIEMTSRALDTGARVTEVPFVFRDRRYGGSKVSLHTLREACLLVLRLGLDRRTRGAARASVPSD